MVGLQEVENLGILEDLAAHDALAEYRYQPALLDGTDSRGIDVGYLVRGDRAEIVRVEQFVAEEGLTSRPPLLVEIEVATDGEALKLYVINNHFSSMSGGELVTEPRRVAQAAWAITTKPTAPAAPLSPKKVEQLRALGYFQEPAAD